MTTEELPWGPVGHVPKLYQPDVLSPSWGEGQGGAGEAASSPGWSTPGGRGWAHNVSVPPP